MACSFACAALRLAVLSLALSAGKLHAEDRIGVVLLHGKHAPKPIAYMAALYRQLGMNDYLLDAPYLPWAKGRIYDESLESALTDIDGSVRRLRARGATKVVLVGHTLGGSAAIAYAAHIGRADAIVVIAPGPLVGLPSFQQRLEGSISKAQKMLQSGQGDKTETFEDISMGVGLPVRTTPSIYLSYMNPDGRANMSREAASFRKPVPVLWITAGRDPYSVEVEKRVFTRFPDCDMSGVVTVDSDRLNAPDASTPHILQWVGALARMRPQ